MANIGLKSGLIFMDIGCGGGFFALPAARVVGESGKVYGIDTNAEVYQRTERTSQQRRFE